MVCERPIGRECHIDVLFVTMEGFSLGGRGSAVAAVVRNFAGAVLRIPHSVAQPWPQATFVAALLSFLPAAACNCTVPFVEDLFNGEPFTVYADGLEARGLDLGAEQPPTWAGDRDRPLSRLTEGRQNGPLASTLAAQQVVSFGLSEDGHFRAAG